MHSDLALKMTADLFWTGLLVCLPVLALTMLVGLAVSIVQVVTQVQELSLSFVPKLVTAAACAIAGMEAPNAKAAPRTEAKRTFFMIQFL